MNFVILTGRLTKTPELKKTATGSTVLSFSLAVDRGDKARTTDFIRCEAWGKTADFIAKYFGKGSPVEINGALRVDKYEKDGRMVELVKVLVNSAAFPIKTNNPPEAQEREKTANTGKLGGVEF
jgi:single-strand DNA-binding protein